MPNTFHTQFPFVSVLASAEGKDGALRLSQQGKELVVYIQNGHVVNIDKSRNNFDWSGFVAALDLPGFSDRDRTQLRKLLPSAQGSLSDALEQIGLEDEVDAAKAEVTAIEKLWAAIFSDAAPEAQWVDTKVKEAPFGIPLDRLYLIAVTKVFGPRKLLDLVRTFGAVQFQAPASMELHQGYLLLPMESERLATLDGSVDVASYLDSLGKDANKVAAMLLVAMMRGLVEMPAEENAPIEDAFEVAAEAEQAPGHWWEDKDQVTVHAVLGASSNTNRDELLGLYKKALAELERADLSPAQHNEYKELVVQAFRIVSNDDMLGDYMVIASRESGVRAIRKTIKKAAEYQVQEAIRAIRKGGFAEGYSTLNKVIDQIPDDDHALCVLALLKAAGHPAVAFDPISALQDLQRAADLRPECASYPYYEGVINEWLDQRRNALEAYDRALRIDPTHKASSQRRKSLAAQAEAAASV